MLLCLSQPALATTVQELMAGLDQVIEQEDRSLFPDSRYLDFLTAIKEAYGVADSHRLNQRLSVAVFSDTRFSPGLRYFSFCRTDSRFSPGCTIKIAVLATLFHEFEAGRLRPKQKAEGRTLLEHARVMIRQSSNSSFNALVRRIGFERINAWLAGLGFSSDELFVGHYLRPAGNAGGSCLSGNRVSARALAKFYFLLAQEETVEGFLTKESLEKIRGIVSSADNNCTPHLNDRLNGSFPAGAVFYHKTGSNNAVAADAGFVKIGGLSCVIAAFDKGKNRGAMRRLGLNLLRMITAPKPY
jgi:beta-lactamase class A